MYAQWYIGGGTSITRPTSASDWSGSIEGDPNATDVGPVRLGTTGFSASQSAGTIQLDLMTEVRNNLVSANIGSTGRAEWQMWYRPNSSCAMG